MIPYGKQSISEDDIEAVVRSLRSDFLTCGPEVEAFEKEFAAFVGAKHAVAVCNATAALHLAMQVLGIEKGDRVVTSPNTFVASANAAAYVGATPDFSDIDPKSYNLDPVVLEKNWKPDTKAVVAVDYAGQPCNMPEIARVARSRGAYVIEDACHGTGGSFQADGRKWKLGGHPWADITTFSFHPVKTVTTGEGGILLTENDEWAATARLLRTHGITRNPSEFTGLSDSPSSSCSAISPSQSDIVVQSSAIRDQSSLAERGPWYYEMQELGYNFRITDLQCALGRSQLKRLPDFITRRQEIASCYNQAFSNLDWLKTPALAPWLLSPAENLISWHLYTVQIDFPRLVKTRIEVMQELREKGVGTQVLYIPVYLQPWYRRTYGYAPGKCPKAEEFYSRALSLPLFPAMNDADVQKVIHAVLALED
ncbi:MAG: UDP-4-amino-4,6-dideoxy-N-acetyl-beta-L-altrosamine transaminase [Proteobacteria bacterium]|nr:UDP-4-amino-4,6-dideoxy-N-acetyl-beta-L-altrosamine transaminase [Pseudomonadota bacterium]